MIINGQLYQGWPHFNIENKQMLEDRYHSFSSFYEYSLGVGGEPVVRALCTINNKRNSLVKLIEVKERCVAYLPIYLIT